MHDDGLLRRSALHDSHGLGAKDASLVALLGKSGVPAHTAIAFAALDRVATTGLTLVIGAICAGILGLKRGRQVESS